MLHPFQDYVFDKAHRNFVSHIAKAMQKEGVKNLITEHYPECSACGNGLIKENAFLKCCTHEVILHPQVAQFLRKNAKDWQKVEYTDGQNFPFHYYNMLQCSKCGLHNHIMIREFLRHNTCEDVIFLTFLQGKDFAKTPSHKVREILSKRIVKRYNSWWITCNEGVIYADTPEFLANNKNAKDFLLHFYNNNKLQTKKISL